MSVRRIRYDKTKLQQALSRGRDDLLVATLRDGVHMRTLTKPDPLMTKTVLTGFSPVATHSKLTPS
jgi:hypothetical protein